VDAWTRTPYQRQDGKRIRNEAAKPHQTSGTDCRTHVTEDASFTAVDGVGRVNTTQTAPEGAGNG
jgi:hypothetical protein